jgi:hypothetical protein
MRYQLVLQFAGRACPTLDDLIALEEELTRHVPTGAVVDGHDIGSGEANIFIVTSDPVATFSALVPALRSREQIVGLGAAYRAERSDEYVRVWPAGSTAPFMVQ